MKQVINYAIYGSVIAIAVGIMSVFGLGILTPAATTSNFVAAPILGHITLTQTDANGNVIAYRQTDNLITNRGENCAAALIFGVASIGTNKTCAPGAMGVGDFKTIAIGNATGIGSVDPNHQLLGRELPAGSELTRSTSTPSLTTEANGATSPAVVKLTKQFNNTITPAQSITVTESGIFNGTTVNAGAMFARQAFTGITLKNGESLTVEWTVSIGGTTGIAQET